MEEKKFKEALYYATRESFNADNSGNEYFIDLRWDPLIREAIKFFESWPHKTKPFPYRTMPIELISLGEAAGRRKRKDKKEVIK